MTTQLHERPLTAAVVENMTPVATADDREFVARLLDRPGLLLKRLVLLAGAVYFAMVAVTNAVNFVASVGHFHWVFLNSGNAAFIASIVRVYSWPVWTINGIVAYTSQSPFRELMVIALLMPVIIAVIPDRAAANPPPS